LAGVDLICIDDPEQSPMENDHLTHLTVDIVVNFLEANTIAANDLPGLIHTVHGALSNIDKPAAPADEPAVRLTAAQIRKSITPDRLISFEDGQGYSMLRRHLTARGLTPDDYRQKWGLPSDYPMTAPLYSEARSNLAKTLGLGRNLKS
jgi:predicted transcriptional regulator